MEVKPYHTYIARNNKIYTIYPTHDGKFFYNNRNNPIWFADGKCCYEQGKHELDLIKEITYIDAHIKNICDIIKDGLYESLSEDQLEQQRNIVVDLLESN